MSTLKEIQSALMKDDTHIGHILLKMRFLAAQIGNDVLADWVKHELEGYPLDAAVPNYRTVSVSYTGTFLGPFGSSISNAPIPSHLIERFADKEWNTHRERQSVSSIYEMYERQKKDPNGYFQIDASNLILLLQGKIYPQYSCNSVHAAISSSQIFNILFSVRSKLLDLTIELNNSLPAIASVTIDEPVDKNKIASHHVNNVVNQVVYGNFEGMTSIGSKNNVRINIQVGDRQSLIKELVYKGLPKDDAEEFADVLDADVTSSNEQPLGKKAQLWFADKARKVAEGAWKVSIPVATEILTEAAKKYLGL